MNPEPLIAVSKAMRDIVSWLPRVASASAPVVLEGETGSGKGRIAEALHELGPRREGPYEVVSCGAIAESLADSEFFGRLCQVSARFLNGFTNYFLLDVR